MSSQTGSTGHGLVFSILVVLVLLAVGISSLHLSAALNNILVFSIAFIMSGLVVAQYMGLRFEGKLVAWIIIIPLLLFAILVIALLPDIAHLPFGSLRER